MATEETPLTAEKLFDSVGAAYEDAFAGLSEQAASLEWILSNLPPATTAKSRILDIGCGTGKPVVSTLSAAGHDVTGIDISSAMIAAAKERVPGAAFQQADFREYLASALEKSETFDAITVYFSLIASVTQEEIKTAMQSVFKLLRPGGLFVFATVPIPSEGAQIRWMGKPVVVSSLAAEEAVQAVKDAGFKVEKEAVSAFTPKASEAGICQPEDVWEEPHLFVYAKKPE